MLKDNLIAARALIDTPEKWTRHTYARNEHGLDVNENSNSAVCFCIMGALNKATGDQAGALPLTQHLAVNLPTKFDRIPAFNDDPTTTHADVLALFDRTIEQC